MIRDDPPHPRTSAFHAEDAEPRRDWRRSLADAVREPAELIARLGLPESLLEPAARAAKQFPLLVPESYLRRMRPGDPSDPLLLQVLPLGDEDGDVPGFTADPLHEAQFRRAPGLLHKYAGRALLIATGACAVHCRYCFRRNYPYCEEPRRWDDWQPALDAIAADESLHEIILSGGDPLMLSDRRLRDLCEALDAIPHLQRLRIHTRLPIVLPERMTAELLEMLSSLRMTVIFVVHANHPNEIAGPNDDPGFPNALDDRETPTAQSANSRQTLNPQPSTLNSPGDCAATLRRMVRSGFTVLNQSVLLRGVNDDADVLAELCERLVNLGVVPYYLHQLDRVAGTAHFEVPDGAGLAVIAELRKRLPGYAVPSFVREVPGELHKVPIDGRNRQ